MQIFTESAVAFIENYTERDRYCTFIYLHVIYPERAGRFSHCQESFSSRPAFVVTCLGCVPSGSNDCNSLILQQCRTRDITLISLEQRQPRLTAKNLTKLKLRVDLNVIIFFRILYIAMCFFWRWLQSMCLPAKQLEISTTNTGLKWSQCWTRTEIAIRARIRREPTRAKE